MCGFTGIVNFSEQENHDVLKTMTDCLDTRGPDATGYWTDSICSIGHKRLIVVDAEGGIQPFHFQNYHLVYNGELYNTDEVRDKLIGYGHQFQSYSDTEVLMHAYAEWKQDCVHHLNGIFAFVVWDEMNQELFMARDRLGVKPLFYHLGQQKLLFASEPKSLLKHPVVSRKVTAEGFASLIALGPGRFPGHDVFRDIHELRPGFRAFFQKNKGFMVQRYWQLPDHKHTDSPEETIQRVRHLTEQAIKRQLVSDVPIGTFLSGGIDSSIITAIAAKHSTSLSTFSVEYADQQHHFQKSSFQPELDGPFIQAMIDAYSLHHTAYSLSSDELFGYLHEAMVARDVPAMGDIDSSLLAFCRLVKPQATVVLSGECADELFAGYPWLQDEEASPDFFWIPAAENRYEALQPAVREQLPLSDFREIVRSSLLFEIHNREHPKAEANHKGSTYLTMQHFMQNLLERKDRMSMRSGLEVRVPFADHELWEYVYNIPLSMKRMGGKEKGLLRAAFHDVLPDAILDRKKNPYPKTFHPVYTSLVRQKLESILQEKGVISTLYRPEFFDELLQGEAHKMKPWFGQLMQAPQVMAHLIQLESWLNEYEVDLDFGK